MDLKFKKESIQRKTAVEGELKGGLLIRDLWTQGTGSIHNMYVVNTVHPSCQKSRIKRSPFYSVLSFQVVGFLFPDDLGNWALTYHMVQHG